MLFIRTERPLLSVAVTHAEIDGIAKQSRIDDGQLRVQLYGTRQSRSSTQKKNPFRSFQDFLRRLASTGFVIFQKVAFIHDDDLKVSSFQFFGSA